MSGGDSERVDRRGENAQMSRRVIGPISCVLAWVALTSDLGISAAEVRGTIAQENPDGFEKLVRALVAELEKAHVKRVAIFDLETADGKQIPLGSWLADRISKELAMPGESVEVVDRERLSVLPNGNALDHEAKTQLRSDTARSLGADAFVDGSFGVLGDGIGITVSTQRVGGERIRISQWKPYTALGEVPLDEEMKKRLGVPIESLRPVDGVYKPGVAGVGIPECSHCPQPQFSFPGVNVPTTGIIAMNVVISAEGKALQVDVTRRAGVEFDGQAVKTVRTWKFKPALDADGNPVVVRQVVEVTFKIY